MNDEGPTIGTWLWLIASIAYAISPIDILPDAVPVAGWVDDLVIAGSGVMNFVQAEVGRFSSTLAGILGTFKWILIVLGVIAILLIALLGGVIYKIFA